MIRFTFYTVLLVGALLLEATFLAVPLTLAGVLLIGIREKQGWSLFLGLFAGLLLDSLTFRPLGASSLFFLCALFLLFLYGRKFEIQHIGFNAFFLFITSSLYGIVFGRQQPLLGALISTALAVGIIAILQVVQSHHYHKLHG